MLIYHPAYDAYHCAYRFLALTDKLKTIEIPKLRIIDFYLIFPAEIEKIRLPRHVVGIKKVASELQNIYHGPLNPLQTFREMKHLQFAALRTLAATNLIDGKLLDDGIVQRLETPLPESASSTPIIFNDPQQALYNFITSELFSWPLNGVNGLKDRTGLMEFRYDNV